MNTYKFLIGLFLCACECSQAQICPRTIDIATKLNRSVDGWMAVNSVNTVKLQSMVILDDDVDKNVDQYVGMLAPGKSTVDLMEWTFKGVDSKYNLVMECQYRNSAISLRKKVDKGVTKCIFFKKSKYLEFEGKCLNETTNKTSNAVRRNP
jgi:hypothetical protein